MPTSLILSNATLWPGDGRHFTGHVVVRDGTIAAVGEGPYRGSEPATDLTGLCLSPGLIDLMLLGGFGRRILHEGPAPILRDTLRIGVTSVLFCGGMVGWDNNFEYARRIRAAMRDPSRDASRLLGWYPEGPFLDPRLTAAMPENAVPPTPGNISRFLEEAGDTFPLINVSPGLEGDVAAIRSMAAAGKVVSMAHANAPPERVRACLDAGTSVLGHYNCNHYGRIVDGRIGPTIEDVALTDDRVHFIHVICDGIHTDDVYVNLCLRARGIEHVCVVTDAQPQAGCADGPFPAEDGRTFIKHGAVARTTDGRLVGSTWMLPDHFRNFLRVTGLPPHVAIRAVTLNPAASLGLDGQIGIIAPGRTADLVAWDPSMHIQRVWRRGVEVQGISSLHEVSA